MKWLCDGWQGHWFLSAQHTGPSCVYAKRYHPQITRPQRDPRQLLQGDLRSGLLYVTVYASFIVFHQCIPYPTCPHALSPSLFHVVLLSGLIRSLELCWVFSKPCLIRFSLFIFSSRRLITRFYPTPRPCARHLAPYVLFSSTLSSLLFSFSWLNLGARRKP